MTEKKRSTITFFILLGLLTAAVAINTLLPQGAVGTPMPSTNTSGIPPWQLALAGAGMTLVAYGILGFLGLLLSRAVALPEMWAAAVSNRQRFLLPAVAGGLCGVFLILLDVIFSPVNGIGRILHPPFPTSLVASFSAGIGEEMLFRLFLVSFWTWLVGRVILRGRGLGAVYWAAAGFSALAFAASHLPALMFLTGETDPTRFSPLLLLEILLMNGAISLVCAYYFKKAGFLAAVGVHFWADIIWHLVWGLL